MGLHGRRGQAYSVLPRRETSTEDVDVGVETFLRVDFRPSYLTVICLLSERKTEKVQVQKIMSTILPYFVKRSYKTLT